MLNLLLYALTRREPDQQLLDFLAVDEMLVDIGDDLVDYEVALAPAASGAVVDCAVALMPAKAFTCGVVLPAL